MSNKKLIVFGAGENSIVVADLALCLGYKINKLIDPHVKDREDILESFENLKNPRDFVYTISVGDNLIRENIYASVKKFIPSKSFVTLIHPSAYISESAVIGMGSLVMANAYIGPCASIGKFTFINTGAQVEHHNTIGDFVNVGPRVTTGGRVIIGARSVIGMSATISDHLTVGASSRIGAMSLVLSDILDDSKVFGIPAKEKLQ